MKPKKNNGLLSISRAGIMSDLNKWTRLMHFSLTNPNADIRLDADMVPKQVRYFMEIARLLSKLCK